LEASGVLEALSPHLLVWDSCHQMIYLIQVGLTGRIYAMVNTVALIAWVCVK
jgi:hypothetical protein